MPKVRRDFHTPEGKARREAEARKFQDTLPWVLVRERMPEYGTGFVLVRLNDGTAVSSMWDPVKGWFGLNPDTVRKIIAWSPPRPQHSCEQ